MPAEAPQCLIVDDEAAIRKTLAWTLESAGWEAQACAEPGEALAAAQDRHFDLALVDLRLGTLSGMELLPQLLKAQPGLPIVMITAYASIPNAVEAMRRGAQDYLPKPFTPDEVRQAAAQALLARVQQERQAAVEIRPWLESKAPGMQRILGQARQVALSPRAPLLLRGETGTGKGVLARAVHLWSQRADKPFVVLACPALPPHLLENELFGHLKGAFTGAHRDQPGRLAQAEGGTLFLDEVGHLSLDLQVKLLRFLQEKEYEPLGGETTLKADVRIMAATHVDLPEAVREGRFREDLYYRLNVVELVLPPLRERLEDLEDLSLSLLEELGRENAEAPKRLQPGALARLRAHSWPGNLRELRNVLERASVFSAHDALSSEDLGALPALNSEAATGAEPDLGSLENIELVHIRRVLLKTRSLDQAARILGMHPATLWRKRKKYKL